MAGTLTGFLIEHNELPYVFLNDLDYATWRGHYRAVVPAVRCALASAIRFNEDVFGALVLLSQ